MGGVMTGFVDCAEAASIATTGLGGIEGLIGGDEQGAFSGGCGAGIEEGGADAAGEGEAALVEMDVEAGDGGVEGVEPLPGCVWRDLGEDEEKLFTAIASGVVIGSLGGGDGFSEPAEGLVAGHMAEGIVDVLEVVEIDDGDDQAGALAAGTVHLSGEDAEDADAIEHAGEPVVSGLYAQ